MPEWAALCAIAYATERVRARRLARASAISEHAALVAILQANSAHLPLAQIIRERAWQRDAEAARRAMRAQQKADWKQRALSDRAADGIHWRAWFDGSAQPNPGQIGLGGELRDPTGRRWQFSLRGDYGDSNQAEYAALIGILEMACQHRAAPLIIHGDSKIVLDDLLGVAVVQSLSAYRKRALDLLAQLPTARCEWVPRHRNSVADALARAAHPGSPPIR